MYPASCKINSIQFMLYASVNEFNYPHNSLGLLTFFLKAWEELGSGTFLSLAYIKACCNS